MCWTRHHRSKCLYVANSSFKVDVDGLNAGDFGWYVDALFVAGILSIECIEIESCIFWWLVTATRQEPLYHVCFRIQINSLELRYSAFKLFNAMMSFFPKWFFHSKSISPGLYDFSVLRVLFLVWFFNGASVWCVASLLTALFQI